MTRKRKVTLILSVFCFLLVGLTSLNKSSKVHSEPGPKEVKQDKSGVERINAKARAVKGPDKKAIEDLTNEIMSQYGWDDAPAMIKDNVKDRLVRAEEKFHKGHHKGVSEIEVARAVNGLAVKFKAPEYAKTSPSEVREVRGRSIAFLPDFIGRGRVEDGKVKAKKPKSAIEEMSPVEAAYVTMVVLHQKVNNPEFQLTQEERRAVWIEKHSKSPRSDTKADSQSSTSTTGRQQEMDGVLRRAASTIPFQDFLTLPDKVLDTLGIDR